MPGEWGKEWAMYSVLSNQFLCCCFVSCTALWAPHGYTWTGRIKNAFIIITSNLKGSLDHWRLLKLWLNSALEIDMAVGMQCQTRLCGFDISRIELLLRKRNEKLNWRFSTTRACRRRAGLVDFLASLGEGLGPLTLCALRAYGPWSRS